ncbi:MULTISPECIES: hypothetical protein [unclassified Nocardioides]|jgi:hypothetical protein|uniref:hypothetical protein n=1 Tax=unclassified Nocardioides TaxID=2615069 RepID=UPI000702747D|nr:MULTISPECIES: hypothetical protein [unclassified Nocardioides]KRC59518.1 hypothetical protein ASE19_00305 [Nocardioides sp. Root79]KRC68658.1 hypothetical protein ASE20_17660 [Nocardioides sp. Root240]
MRVRLATAALAGVVLVSVLAGCSDDKDPGGDDPTSAAPTGTTSSTPSETPSDTASATVEPATGPEIHLPESADLRLIAGPEWKITDNGEPLVLADASVDGALAGVRVDISEFPQIGDDLAQLAKISLRIHAQNYKARLRHTGYRDVKGVKGYVFEGTGLHFNYYEWGGLDAGNRAVVLTFMIPTELDLADYVEPALASLEWRS